MNSNPLISLLPAIGLALGGCSAAATIPDTLSPAAGATLAMILPAKGAQIYECRANKTRAGQFEWAFVAPDAELLDARGNHAGRHGAGPYWQALDGSRVVASVASRADAPTAGTIPWLLLTARNDGPEGSFSRVSAIQRVNTTGGAAPQAPCTREKLGQQARVPYTADYRFFTSSTLTSRR
ncbi:MAG TPA: DUF3455 domain-containing protein [Usitatibacter sp.]|nr:DUF3455 domain-containing protein [Usitatibacter sp.]